MVKFAKKRKGKTKNITKKPLTRKELRKQKQIQKKENKRLFFSKAHQNDEAKTKQNEKCIVNSRNTEAKQKQTKKQKKLVIAPEDMPIEQLLTGHVNADDDESIASDFSDEEVDARLKGKLSEAKNVRKSKLVATAQARLDAGELHRRELQKQKDLEQAAKKQRIKMLRIQNEDDDKEIARLEKKLKLNRTKDKNRLVRKMFDDGLDYALDLCLDDEEERKKLELKEKRKEEQLRRENGEWSEEDIFGDENDYDDGYDNDDQMVSKANEKNKAKSNSKDSDSDREGFDDSDDEEDGDLPVSDDEGTSNDDEHDGDDGERSDEGSEQEDFVEDIYGRKRDRHGNIIKEQSHPAVEAASQADVNAPSKYIPPHLRARIAAAGNTSTNTDDTKQTEILERLRKTCKGLLNRLSEANLHKISTGVEQLYMKNSRHNMNETLMALLGEALIGRTMVNERMMQEHMVFLAYLHAHIGSEIGAHFLQCFVEKFSQMISNLDDIAVEDKRLNNLVLILSYMYMFKMFEHRLLIQIVENLASRLCEKSVECLLLVFQSVGFKLRKDDPVAFKQMLVDIQRQIAEAPPQVKENTRLKYMLDILTAVKNNNLNKVPKFDPDLAENLRKQLKAMLRNDKYVITLNIAMEDLLRADQIGKWWVVGSAWSGNVNDLAAAKRQQKDTAGGTGGAAAQRFSQKLLDLARKQKMNTEERRNIFCILMSAEDYVDAFEKILHLSLKDQRTIAYVILHCCLNEKQVNPYYSHLASKFCNYNRKFQLAFQFAAWDRINDIEALSKQQVKNLASFLQQLIANGGLPFTVLKVVDFVQLHKLSFLLMKEIIVGLLLGSGSSNRTSEQDVYKIFEKLAKNSKLDQFKQSLRLFMQHFLLKEKRAANLQLNDEQMDLLEKRIDYIDKLLAYVDL